VVTDARDTDLKIFSQPNKAIFWALLPITRKKWLKGWQRN